MITTILIVLATWLVLGSAATYVWLTVLMHADQSAADAAFDRDLDDLLNST